MVYSLTLTRIIQYTIGVALEVPLSKQLHDSVDLLGFTWKMEAAQKGPVRRRRGKGGGREGIRIGGGGKVGEEEEGGKRRRREKGRGEGKRVRSEEEEGVRNLKRSVIETTVH